MKRRLTMIAALLGAGGAASAQALDCSNPQTQVEMTGCAAQAYDASDAELNAVWRDAVAMARRIDDAYLPAGEPSAVDMLRTAQRSWITFRDEACAAESLLARGGSMQNQLFYICLNELTQQRTRSLRQFSTAY